ncbi:MAG: histidinol dehydrogenase [Candidatus Hydrothermarchaeales archaeon]
MLTCRLDELNKDQKRKFFDRKGLMITEDVSRSVKKIVDDVKRNGDSAIRSFTELYDGVSLSDFRVTDEEFENATNRVDENVFKALEVAYKNIKEFHEKQLKGEWFYEKKGIRLGQITRPFESVGCYVPGGKANYPSTVLMTVVPAKVAGVDRVVCVTPPNRDGNVNDFTLLAYMISGAKEVYKVGGAQAIAALAYGTDTIPKVEKIVGPGNIYVTAAKNQVFGDVAIDNPAGPSEVLIIADETANAGFIAVDMIAQAEHDVNACSVLISSSEKIAEDVKNILENSKFNREETKKALEKNGAIVTVDNIDEAVKFSNKYAPEHLQIIASNDKEILKEIRNAGSIFLGNFTPVACGDYASGTNHVLPTMGYAKVYSGLSVFDFVKLISVQRLEKEALEELSDVIITLAEAEGLMGHAESVRKRIKK